MNRCITFDRTDAASVYSALEKLQGLYADDKQRWEKERRALQKQVSKDVQLREARERVRLLEHVVDQVRAWHDQLAKDGGGYHADLHTILLQAKRDEEP